MKLTGQEKEQLQQALLDAFNHSSLKQMLTFKLDKDLDSITTANGFSNIVFDLTDKANKQGWISQLITSAKEFNPSNQLLANTSFTLLAKLQEENVNTNNLNLQYQPIQAEETLQNQHDLAALPLDNQIVTDDSNMLVNRKNPSSLRNIVFITSIFILLIGTIWSYNPFKPQLFKNYLSLSSFEFETVKVDTTGKIIERNKKQAKQITEDLGNGVVLEMVEIPGGTFLMGTSESDIEKVVAEYEKYGYSEKDARKWVGWETPQHQVIIPALYIGKYQVTQAQWKAIMGNNPSYFTGNDNLPVENVSWDDAVEFCKKLSEKTKKSYRLPSEAEWEYAARAGNTTAFAFGETITPEIVNYDCIYPYGEAPKGEYGAKTIPVGSLGVANEFGLYDMNGNVWEWCQDTWHDNYKGAPTDSSAWEIPSSKNTNRILRGGSYLSIANVCRSALRGSDAPDARYGNDGFRVVMITRTLK